PFKLRQPHAEAVGPMKPLRGPTLIAGEKWTNLWNKDSRIDQDTEGRVGKALGRLPFKRSREKVPDPYPVLFLDTEAVSSNLQS
ncbi:MAG TPA: hypothetical protein VMV04_22390, partial [Thermodesulfobacteriota bacterium]|nr:hypothetical protein [Thermodesulfobacteriota bacterium]